MKVTLKGFIIANKSKRYDAKTGAYVDHISYSFSQFDSSKYDANDVVVREQSFEADVPDDFDPRPGIVANLEREKQKITADFQARVTELNAQIQSALAIEA
jgi:hypothetical protein